MDMMWTEQLSVGNAILDSDHKEMLGLIIDIGCITKAKDRSVLAQAFKLLKGCMDRHFLNEELFAHALNIPFAKHQQDYQNMRAEIDFTIREIEKDNAVTVYEMGRYAQLLRDWLIKHIVEEDMLMKPALQTRPYDFKIYGVGN